MLQRLAYLAVIFVLFPADDLDGTCHVACLVSAFPAIVTVLGGHAIGAHHPLLRIRGSRSVPAVHIVMVGAPDSAGPHASDDRSASPTQGAHVSKISRRKLITTGIAAAAGAGLAAAARIAQLTDSSRPITAASMGPGETLTYAAQRLLTRNSLAREFRPGQISQNPSQTNRTLAARCFKRQRPQALRIGGSNGRHGGPPAVIVDAPT